MRERFRLLEFRGGHGIEALIGESEELSVLVNMLQEEGAELAKLLGRGFAVDPVIVSEVPLCVGTVSIGLEVDHERGKPSNYIDSALLPYHSYTSILLASSTREEKKTGTWAQYQNEYEVPSPVKIKVTVLLSTPVTIAIC
jgi:hypothetical protein